MARGSGKTLQRLFQAAVELISEKGYAGTSVDAIVERAGVAKGTVYYHFKSKAELVDAVFQDGLASLGDSFRRETEGAQGPEQALRALVHAELSYIKRYEAFSKLLMSELWRVDRDWQQTVYLLHDRYAAVFAEVLDAGVEAGAFRADLDTRATAAALFGMIATAALDWLVFSPERRLEDVEQALTELVVRAVVTPGRTGE